VLPPTQVAGLTGVKAIAVGTDSACAIESDQSVWCWGENAYGLLGHDPSSDAICASFQGTQQKCSPTPTKVATLFASQVSVGRYFWDEDGNLGQGTILDGGSAAPLPVKNVSSNITEVSASRWTGDFACAVEGNDHSVWCWGNNFAGELGHTPGTLGDSNVGGYRPPTNATPAKVTQSPNGTGGTFGNVVHVNAGSLSTCAVRTDGTVWCWGANQDAQLGSGNTTGTAQPTQVMTVTDAGAVTGTRGICATTTGGSVYCWGDAIVATVPGTASAGCYDWGAGTTSCVLTPTEISAFAATQTDIAIESAVAISAGAVVRWGVDYYPFGATDAGYQETPVPVSGLP
jgi:alpha-tubulin suppressor-like RCC1 family protein